MRPCVIPFAVLLLATGCVRPDAGPPAATPPKPPARDRAVVDFGRVQVGGVRVHPDLLTGKDSTPEPRTLPVAPPPRKVVRCNCIYCSCTHKPDPDFPQFNKCRCNEERCKQNGFWKVTIRHEKPPSHPV